MGVNGGLVSGGGSQLCRPPGCSFHCHRQCEKGPVITSINFFKKMCPPRLLPLFIYLNLNLNLSNPHPERFCTPLCALKYFKPLRPPTHAWLRIPAWASRLLPAGAWPSPQAGSVWNAKKQDQGVEFTAPSEDSVHIHRPVSSRKQVTKNGYSRTRCDVTWHGRAMFQHRAYQNEILLSTYFQALKNLPVWMQSSQASNNDKHSYLGNETPLFILIPFWGQTNSSIEKCVVGAIWLPYFPLILE